MVTDARFDAVLFDRDGTLIENIPYLTDPEAVRPVPQAAATLPAPGRTAYSSAS
jgi:hypothetical protein